jgi:hypothetical protein
MEAGLATRIIRLSTSAAMAVRSPDIMSRDGGNYRRSWQSAKFWRLSVRDNHAPELYFPSWII